MKLQEYFFKTALAEHGIDKEFLHNHRHGYQEIGSHKFGIKFPMSYVTAINKLNRDKIYDYCFIGSIDKRRGRDQMLTPFIGLNSVIQHSAYGRKPETKYQYRDDYYQIVSNSRFCLCPNHIGPWYQHEWGWTYRFIESVLCRTIPVVFQDTWLGKRFVQDIQYVWDTDVPHRVDDYENIVEENYKKALQYWTLQPDEIEKINANS